MMILLGVHHGACVFWYGVQCDVEKKKACLRCPQFRARDNTRIVCLSVCLSTLP